jgi:hypothetical protein
MDEHETENFGRFKQALIDHERSEDDFDAEEYHQWLDELDDRFLEREEQEFYEEQEHDDYY